MNPSASLRFVMPFVLLCSGLAAASVPPSDSNTLIVVDGNFSHDGKTETASLKNLTEFIRSFYPQATITMVAVEAVQVGNVTVQWHTRRPPPPDVKVSSRGAASLLGVLHALAEASGRQFEVVSFDENDFLLRRPGGTPSAGARTVQVFNLSALMSQRDELRDLERIMRDNETQLEVLRQSSRNDKDRDILVLQEQVQVTARKIALLQKPKADVPKLLNQIEEVVQTTLRQLHPSGEYPAFKYHEGMNLLVVIGNEESLSVTGKVIDALLKNY